jgi:hypothetical protein
MKFKRPWRESVAPNQEKILTLVKYQFKNFLEGALRV